MQKSLGFFIALFSVFFTTTPSHAAKSTCNYLSGLQTWQCSLYVSAHPKMPVLAYFKAPSNSEEKHQYHVIFHLHGIYEDNDNIKTYKFEEKMSALGERFLLLVPRSRGVRVDYASIRYSRTVFKNILKQSAEAIAAETGLSFSFSNKVIGTAHSGGYIPLAGMLEHSSTVFNGDLGKNDVQIDAVGLLDALYSDDETWVYQKFARYKKKFLSLYRKTNGSETAYYNRSLLNYFKSFKITEQEMTDANMLALQKGKNDLSIFWTTEDHYDLVRNWYLPIVDWLGELSAPATP